mmetsp:Transcript_16917/g.33050  ORF Transcript_16917/g.33050 Transcript_16917/m.33050 type:complete len:142 (-) Transcript_16917:202-627(-)
MAEEKEVRDFVTAYCEATKNCMGAVGDQKVKLFKESISNMISDDWLCIRPSGNPMDMKMWEGMMDMMKDTAFSWELMSIDTVKVLPGGKSAVVTITTHEKFTFQGTENDDIAKHTWVVVNNGDGWKCTHDHRATGQPPKKE